MESAKLSFLEHLKSLKEPKTKEEIDEENYKASWLNLNYRKSWPLCVKYLELIKSLKPGDPVLTLSWIWNKEENVYKLYKWRSIVVTVESGYIETKYTRHYCPEFDKFELAYTENFVRNFWNATHINLEPINWTELYPEI